MSNLKELADIAKRMACCIIECEEFSVEVDNNRFYRLIDMQHANLGGIEDESFSSLGEVLGRMQIYHKDYFFEDMEERFDDNSNIGDFSWEVVLCRCLCSRAFFELLSDRPCDDDISSSEFTFSEMCSVARYIYSKNPDLRELRSDFCDAGMIPA